jgi:hypothetical protein
MIAYGFGIIGRPFEHPPGRRGFGIVVEQASIGWVNSIQGIPCSPIAFLIGLQVYLPILYTGKCPRLIYYPIQGIRKQWGLQPVYYNGTNGQFTKIALTTGLPMDNPGQKIKIL